MDMFKNFYSDDALPMGFDKTRLPQDKWTPAEVVQVLLKKKDKCLLKTQILGFLEQHGKPRGGP